MTDDPKLPCELVIGAGHFHKGVSVSTAQGAIDRMYARLRALEDKYEPLSEEAKALFGQFKRATDGPTAAPSPVSAVERTPVDKKGGEWVRRSDYNEVSRRLTDATDDALRLHREKIDHLDARIAAESAFRKINPDVMCKNYGCEALKLIERGRILDNALREAEGLLRELVDSLEAEAIAKMAADVAVDNFSDPNPEMDKCAVAMVRASNAMKAAQRHLDSRTGKEHGEQSSPRNAGPTKGTI